jgi:hypothetical protein
LAQLVGIDGHERSFSNDQVVGRYVSQNEYLAANQIPFDNFAQSF